MTVDWAREGLTASRGILAGTPRRGVRGQPGGLSLPCSPPTKFPRAIQRELAAMAGARVFVQSRRGSFDFFVKWTQALAQFV